MKIDKNGYSARSFLHAVASSMLAMMLVIAAVSAYAGEPLELIPKVWFSEPAEMKRMAVEPLEMKDYIGGNPWLEPSRDIHDIFGSLGMMFKSVAVWRPRERYAGDYRVYPTCTVRVLDDKDKDALFSEQQFYTKVHDVVRRSTFVHRREWEKLKNADCDAGKDKSKQWLVFIDKSIAMTNDAFAVSVMLASSNQQEHIELVSKRYLNVNGRFLYLGVRDFVDGGVEKVESRAGEHTAWLQQWEQDIRRCTHEKRLEEFSGDEAKMNVAIAQEIIGWRQAKQEQELRERAILLARLRDESHAKLLTGPKERISIFGGIQKEKGVKGRYRGIGGLVVMMLDAMGISAGWVIVLVLTFVILLFVLFALRIARDWQCQIEKTDVVMEFGGVKEGVFTCMECGTRHRGEDAVVIRLHGNRRTVQVSKEKTISVETTVIAKVPVCTTCEKALYDRIGFFNRVCYAVFAGIFGVVAVAFYLFRFTIPSSVFLSIVVVILLGIAYLIARQSWLARLGMDVDAYFMRVDELRKLKIALGFSVGKSNADIQQPLERSEESSANA